MTGNPNRYTVRQWFRGASCLFSNVLDFFMPVRCAGCGVPVGSETNMLCDACVSQIILAEGGCPVCGGSMDGGHCRVCTERAWYVTRNIPVAEYRGVMREILHAFKFRGVRALHARLGGLALAAMERARVTSDIITFVPMNAEKKRKRGYNQSELIARHLSRAAGIPCRPLLAERRGAPTQRDLGFRERFINTQRRYIILPGAGGDGRSVLIVDDVFTTGATVNQCARLLRGAGFREVFSLTMARAEIKRLEK